MGKNGLIAFVLAVLMLVTTALPVCAAGTGSLGERYSNEDDYGGLARPPEKPPRGESRPAGEGDYGGLAPTEVPNGPKRNVRPATDADNGGIAPVSESQTDTADKKKQKSSAGETLAGISLTTDVHTAYVYGSSGAFPSFHPGREVTRAEAAVMLSRLLPSGTPVPNTDYDDVPAGAFYADAVKTLAGLGVLEAEDGRLDTGRTVTKGEFIRYIASFFPLRTDAEQFPDVSENDPNAPYILSARAYGWTEGNSAGEFQPDMTVDRASAVVLLNRALGRKADRSYIDQNHPAFYVDVAPSSWYYNDVMEATVPHQHSVEDGTELWTSHTPRTEAPKDGFQLVDGWLYCYDSARGDLVRDDTVKNHYFNSVGRFTTGNNELDSWLHKIVLARTDSSMTQEKMLRAVYLYTRDSFTYLRRPPYEFGVYDYMETDALRILTTGYGNCYCYASLFWYLSRWIGYDSVIYNGTVGVRRSPHSWVEINMDGKNYIFDTELEMAYRRKKRFDVNLYKFYDAGNSWNYRRPKS